MQTKSYFASSIPAALEFARTELGENAMLIGSKPAPPEARQYGRIEVTFAFDPDERVNVRMVAQASACVPQTLSARLIEAGFSPELAAELDAACALREGSREASVDTAIVAELTSRIPVAPFVDLQPGESRTLAFIGAPGRGKTMSLTKIAVNKGISRRLPVRICSAGSCVTGAKDRLARFAAILGTPFRAYESPAGLHEALADKSWIGLTLIDTPGISPAERNELEQLKNTFRLHPEIETHLVLRADSGAEDLLHTITRFAPLKPSRLLIAGMDEAIRSAPVIETLIRSGIPATFAGTGQKAPQDLQEINAEKLARTVWVDGRSVNRRLLAGAATA
jgi:flagellar biosynthesis protein FlhF